MDNVPNQLDEQVPGGVAPQEIPQDTPPSKTAIENLKEKKGWKTDDDVAKFAEETEKSYSRQQNINHKVKQQLEAAGYSIDEEGNIVSQTTSSYPTNTTSSAGQYQQDEGPIYDPYTGQPINDPIAAKLARMPFGQREMFIVNGLLEQREKQQVASSEAEVEILSKPEAKGFEEDVRKVMRTIPLAQRANKKIWEDALLRVKGMKYDEAIRTASEHGVDAFLNKSEISSLPNTSGGDTGGRIKLTAEEEQTFNYYQKNMPGKFKDRADFVRYARDPSGGR